MTSDSPLQSDVQAKLQRQPRVDAENIGVAAKDNVVTLTGQDIAEAVVSAMHWDFEVPTDQIKVIVKNGRVTLEGSVDWQYQKDAAERCVHYLMGVTAVTNMIAINPMVKWADVNDKIPVVV
jgi:osmotically-inducible protein OsmY